MVLVFFCMDNHDKNDDVMIKTLRKLTFAPHTENFKLAKFVSWLTTITYLSVLLRKPSVSIS